MSERARRALMSPSLSARRILIRNGDLRFGYSKEESGHYKPVPNDDAKYVVMAYELQGADVTDQEIADELNRAGSRTYRLIMNAKKKAGPETDLALRRVWTKDSVAGLFSREAAQLCLGKAPYIGEKERTKAKYAWQVQIRYAPMMP